MENLKFDLPVLAFVTMKDWKNWLDKNHAQSSGIWLQIYKKASKVATVTYAEAVEAALCYGWIDSQVKKYDADSYVQRFTPRGKKSVWSQINRENIERLIREKRMQPAGLVKVEEAKADGRWAAAYASPKNVQISPEFEAALNANKKAKAFYETLSKANKYGMITRIHFAKKPETKAKRIKEFITMLEQGKKLH